MITMINEYGAGGLVLFTAPTNPRTNDWPSRINIDASVAAVHAGATQIGDVDGNGTKDIVVAEQEQSHDDGACCVAGLCEDPCNVKNDRIMVFFRDANTWRRQILANTGGHNPKLGDIDNDGDLDLVNANHGHYGAPNPLELWRNLR